MHAWSLLFSPKDEIKHQTDNSKHESSSGESHIHHSDTYVHCDYVLHRKAIVRYTIWNGKSSNVEKV